MAANEQVETGALLLRIRATGQQSALAGGLASVDLAGLTAPPDLGVPPCERVNSVLLSYLLGYDLDPASVQGAISRQRRLGEVAAPADTGLLRCEDLLLDIFTDVASLYRPKTEPAQEGEYSADGSKEYLLSYLQWLDADKAELPGRYRERLMRALRRYGVDSLECTPRLKEAVVWLFRSFQRVGELTPAVTSILERRVRHRESLRQLAAPELRARLDLLAAATQGRYQDVADLARDVRFHYLDEPLLRADVANEYAEMEGHLEALRADPGGPGRLDRIGELVWCRQALQTMLLRHWLATGPAASADAFREVLLEVVTRRFYRIRDLRDLTVAGHGAQLWCSADYEVDDRRIHLVVAYLPLAELPGLSAAMARHLAEAEPGRKVVVDLHTWRRGGMLSDDDAAAQIAGLLSRCEFSRRLWRLDVTVTSTTGSAAGRCGTQHVTFRQRGDGGFEEDLIYRNLHPMLAKRLDLWRLANFRLRRLPSADDVHVFHGIARDNPEDQRLFALAEVRDLIPVRDAAGAVSYPRLELMGLSAISAMRQALAAMPADHKPAANRIVLSVRPLWDIPPQQWPDVARSFAPVAVAAGLQKVVLRVRIPGPGGEPRASTLHIDGVGRHGVVVRERPLGQEPIRPLSPYRQKVLRAQRLGAPYPYEIVRMLAPRPGTVAHFPAGHFVEYDLDEADQLVPVDRDHGRNTANVVVGLLHQLHRQDPRGHDPGDHARRSDQRAG